MGRGLTEGRGILGQGGLGQGDSIPHERGPERGLDGPRGAEGKGIRGS